MYCWFLIILILKWSFRMDLFVVIKISALNIWNYSFLIWPYIFIGRSNNSLTSNDMLVWNAGYLRRSSIISWPTWHLHLIILTFPKVLGLFPKDNDALIWSGIQLLMLILKILNKLRNENTHWKECVLMG